MKTVDVRLLVHDDVDEQFLVEQLVSASHGAGAPLGAVRTINEGYYDEVGPADRVVVRLGFDRWNGEHVAPGGLTT